MLDPDFSLDGFLYDPNPQPDYTKVMRMVWILLSVVTVITISAITLFIYNRKLNKEVSERTKHLSAEIAEREQVEKNLKANESFLNSVIDNIPNMIFIKDGEPLFLLGISEDITERKLASKERMILETKLHQAQKLESIGTLAGGIAHDFNNILTAVMGYTELAMVDIDNPETLQNDLKEVLQGANRARELVKQILTFSRKSDQNLKPIRIQLVIYEVLKL